MCLGNMKMLKGGSYSTDNKRRERQLQKTDNKISLECHSHRKSNTKATYTSLQWDGTWA